MTRLVADIPRVVTRSLLALEEAAIRETSSEVSFAALKLRGCDQSHVPTPHAVGIVLSRFSIILETFWSPSRTILLVDIATCNRAPESRYLAIHLGVGCIGDLGQTALEVTAMAKICRSEILAYPNVYDVSYGDPEEFLSADYSDARLIVQESFSVSTGERQAGALSQFRRGMDTWQGLVDAMLALDANTRVRATLLATRPSDEQRATLREQLAAANEILRGNSTDSQTAVEAQRVILTLSSTLRQYDGPVYIGELAVMGTSLLNDSFVRRIASSVSRSSLSEAAHETGAVSRSLITSGSAMFMEPTSGGFRLEPAPHRFPSATANGLPYYGGLTSPRLCDLLSLDAAKCIFQWPVPYGLSIPTIPVGAFKPLPPTGNRVARGTNVGRASDGTEVLVDDSLRARHIHIVGTPGSGKTTLLAQLIRGDIAIGRGFLAVDPHGDLASRVEASAKEFDYEIQSFSPDRENLIQIALFPPAGDKESAELVEGVERAAARIIDAVTSHLEDPRYAGPRFRTTSRAALILLGLAGRGKHVADVADVLQDQEFFEELRSAYRGPQWVVKHLNNHHRMNSGEGAEMTDYVVAKYQDLLSSKAARSLVAPIGGGVEIGELMRQGAGVLLSLSQTFLSTLDVRLVGHVVLSSVVDAMFERRVGAGELFSVYVDEIHAFPERNFERGLEQGRKFGIGFVLAHQFIRQLDDRLRSALVGHCGLDFVFRLAPEDAEYYSRVLGHPSQDLRGQPDLHSFVKMSPRGAASPMFSLFLDPPDSGAAW